MFSFYSTLFDPLLKEVRTYVPRFSGMKKGDRVLDVCCGTGDQAFYYRRINTVVAAVDLNPKMIEVAEQRKEKEKYDNLFFLLCDAKNLPFEDNFFDFASVSLALHEIDKKGREEVMSEMKRVVKKNGNLVFVDFSDPLPKKFSSLLINSMEFLAGRRNFRNFKDYFNNGGLPLVLKKSGLKEEKIDYLKGGLITLIKAKNSKQS